MKNIFRNLRDALIGASIASMSGIAGVGFGVALAPLALHAAVSSTVDPNGVAVQNNGVAAPAGYIGEDQSLSVVVGSAITYTTTATPYNLGSLTLSQGRWICQAHIINTAAGTTFTSSIVAFNTTSATLPTAPAGGYAQAAQSSTIIGGVTSGLYSYLNAGPGPVTMYVVSQAAFTGTAPTFYGGADCIRTG
jgi:hypothetical protein